MKPCAKKIEDLLDTLPYAANAVYRFVSRYKQEHDGCSPTLEEICTGCGVSSKSVASALLRQLEEKGLIGFARTRDGSGRALGITISGGHWQPPQLRTEVL